MQQDCQGDDLECVGLECISKSDTNRIPLRDIGIQTSLSYVEKKNASTSIDRPHVPVQAKATKKLTRNCKTGYKSNIQKLINFFRAFGEYCQLSVLLDILFYLQALESLFILSCRSLNCCKVAALALETPKQYRPAGYRECILYGNVAACS